MRFDRLSWTGFGIVLIGWVVLLAAITVSDATLRVGSLVAALSWRGDIVTVAQTAILSGFGLAVVGTLRSGFGAFTRFFDAVLQRSGTPRPTEPTPLEPAPLDDAREPEAAAQEGIRPRELDAADPGPVVSDPDRLRGERARVARRRDRNFVILSDGSVEVETMFGTRVFASMDEARDFIR